MLNKPDGSPVFPDRFPRLKTFAPIHVGIGIAIVRDRKLLVTRRKEACQLGVGALAMPGGSIDFQEKISTVIKREGKEETGLDLIPGMVNNSLVWHVEETFPDHGHGLTLYTVGLISEGSEPENREPHKHEEWIWMSLSDLEGVYDRKIDWIPIRALIQYAKELSL